VKIILLGHNHYRPENIGELKKEIDRLGRLGYKIYGFYIHEQALAAKILDQQLGISSFQIKNINPYFDPYDSLNVTSIDMLFQSLMGQESFRTKVLTKASADGEIKGQIIIGKAAGLDRDKIIYWLKADFQFLRGDPSYSGQKGYMEFGKTKSEGITGKKVFHGSRQVSIPGLGNYICHAGMPVNEKFSSLSKTLKQIDNPFLRKNATSLSALFGLSVTSLVILLSIAAGLPITGSVLFGSLAGLLSGGLMSEYLSMDSKKPEDPDDLDAGPRIEEVDDSADSNPPLLKNTLIHQVYPSNGATTPPCHPVGAPLVGALSTLPHPGHPQEVPLQNDRSLGVAQRNPGKITPPHPFSSPQSTPSPRPDPPK